MAGDSPENQQKQIERHVKSFSIALNRNIKVVKWFEFTESGSDDPDFRQFKHLEHDLGRME